MIKNVLIGPQNIAMIFAGGKKTKEQVSRRIKIMKQVLDLRLNPSATAISPDQIY